MCSPERAGCDGPCRSLAERSYPSLEVKGCGPEELPHARGSREEQRPSKERQLRGCRRAERSYSTFKVRRGSCEEIPLVQGKEQQLCFAGAAIKRYPTSKERETQIRW